MIASKYLPICCPASIRGHMSLPWTPVIRLSDSLASNRAAQPSVLGSQRGLSNRSQMPSQLLLGIEHSPLHCADWDRPSRRDFVVFPLLDKTQQHRLALFRLE